MKIAIIGAGFTGLSSAYKLSQHGHDITVFEKDSKPGGLAIGYKKPHWKWTLEKHYHHWFTNDKAILTLARDLDQTVITRRPKTSVFVHGTKYQLDSPMRVLKFPKLSFAENMQMAAVLTALKLNPFWKPLEKYSTERVLTRLMGEKAYKLLWQPQLDSKFDAYAKDISLAWFWARIKKRTPSLSYPEKGFLHFAEQIENEISSSDNSFLFKTTVTSIQSKNKKVIISYKKGSRTYKKQFDNAVVTLPANLFLNLTSDLPSSYVSLLSKLKGIGAINMVLRLNKQFLEDDTYWLSICDRKAPVMAVVEHTNWMGKSNYGGEHLVYVGNYASKTSKLYAMNSTKLLKHYDPFLKSINKSYRKNLIGYDVFQSPFAQPIITTNYSKAIPPHKTPINNVYLANMQQVYPWDRGTNYATELGFIVADFILSQ